LQRPLLLALPGRVAGSKQASAMLAFCFGNSRHPVTQMVTPNHKKKKIPE
jgi:hypothetical protein